MAARVFPLGHYARLRPVSATLVVGKLLPPAFVLRQVNIGLSTDPYSPELLHAKAYLEKETP